MNNLLKYRVETSLGAAFISMLSVFFVALTFVAVKNFETDMDMEMIMSGSNTVKVRKMSATELILLREWISSNSIEVPDGEGYNYLRHRYPEKPWLQ